MKHLHWLFKREKKKKNYVKINKTGQKEKNQKAIERYDRKESRLHDLYYNSRGCRRFWRHN